jgi:hypothetical protein
MAAVRNEAGAPADGKTTIHEVDPRRATITCDNRVDSPVGELTIDNSSRKITLYLPVLYSVTPEGGSLIISGTSDKHPIALCGESTKLHDRITGKIGDIMIIDPKTARNSRKCHFDGDKWSIETMK